MQKIIDPTKPFIITKHVVLPEEAVMVPRGDILRVGFHGNTAFAWIMSEPEAVVDMSVIALADGGPYELTVDAGYQPPEHVGTFIKETMHKLLPSVWHVFRWLPKAAGPMIVLDLKH
jgi:hypothetical protein